MQTFSQICADLGYTSYAAGYDKLSRAGIELASLPRFMGEDKRTFFYDDETAEYLKSVIKPCNKKYQAAMLKRLDAKKVPVQMQSDDKVLESVPEQKVKKGAVKTEMKSEKKAAKAVKKESAPKVAGFEQRFQQIQVLGSLLNEQISQLSREMAASRKSAMA